MNDDMIMARGEESDSNLAIGEPVFIQEATELEFVAAKLTPKEWQYQSAAGTPHLKGLLEELSGKHVVVCNGAKQALVASIKALKQPGNIWFEHKAPFWPSMPALAKQGGGHLIWEPAYIKHYEKFTTKIVTSPGNPQGLLKADGKCHIWDAVYNSKVYNLGTPVKLDCDVMVDSVSKKYGFSGLRVGWACFESKKHAAIAEHFVEMTTSGVSVAAQKIAHATLLYELSTGHAPFDEELAACTLRKNAEMFNDVLLPYVDEVQGVPAGNGGMFAFFKVNKDVADAFNSALVRSGVKLIPGKLCGIEEPNWYRMSMGQTNLYTEHALDILEWYLNEELL